MEDDIETFIRALAYQWAIWGTDAHAKNYSLVLAEGAVRLASLYDIASFLPYAKTGPDAKSVRLPMHVGREYRVRSIRREHWADLAVKTGPDLKLARTLNSCVAWITSTPVALEAVISELPDGAIQSGFADRLLEGVNRHCRQINGNDVWPGEPRPKPELYRLEPKGRVFGWASSPSDCRYPRVDHAAGLMLIMNANRVTR
ncbi:HipA domain-containing protein [Arthrobacter sp. ISL-30]|uniref:HipA domain-containing protein n=1 Tax=Arthrobacter sp. ISL-30 TaxID=2819109 RepID=UPI001BE74903|nr:HipA domain-containing protein [Arthrobacter sp. ISL-30]MBT2515810.1 HipA domain-containing protein [Arthrobacter sp. ISL-30]